jgi:hypothetical protein
MGVLSPRERVRLAALLGMLGSDHAGERDNAGRLAEQLVRGRGTTWQAVLTADEPVNIKGYAEGFTDGYDNGFADGYTRARRDLLPEWRVMRERCLELPDLSAREREFLESLARWRRLTPRQQAWLEAIFARVPPQARAAA